MRKLYTKEKTSDEQYFYFLDILRWFCAINVVFWHYQFFYTEVIGAHVYSKFTPPFYKFLNFFYSGNLGAVTMFWMISGFVISFKYSGGFNSRKEFLLNRFARLYPLHILALILTAILQYSFLWRTGKFLVYTKNNFVDFFLNLFMINGWGPSNYISFNAPFWSVSLEIIIYVLFAVTLNKTYRYGPLLPIFFTGLFFILNKFHVHHNFALWECGEYFYIGVIINYYRKLLVGRRIWLFILVVSFFSLCDKSDRRLFIQLLIVMLVLFLDFSKKLMRVSKIKILGDISYSIYLIHFPITILILLAIHEFNLNQNKYASNMWFLFLYIICLNISGMLLYTFFEKPIRRKIKEIFSSQ